MKKILYLFAFMTIALTSCDKNENNSDLNPNSTATAQIESVNRAIRPVVLGDKLNNPFSVENMQAALDTLKAHTDQLDGCMKAPSSINEIEISTTDLYVRFLPQDSTQYKLLMTDSTLTLFDFPLDYEIKQNGDYYLDPTVTGNYTWLYTRVPKGYQPPQGIQYEVISELFLYENSPYYSEEVISSDGSSKVKSKYGSDMNDALKTIKAIAFFNTGNKYGETNSAETPTGMQKIRKAVKKKFLWKTWTDYEYYPSGTVKVESYHSIDKNGNTTVNSNLLTAVPLQGVKVHFWNWFKWNSVYTNDLGYYESNIYYDGNPNYYLYFSGQKGANSWDLDRVTLWGVCLWVQKFSLGENSRDEFNTTISQGSGAWDACITNNAFYEYMTLCDKEGLTRPSGHLQVALREGFEGGSSSAPLFQVHNNTLTTSILAGFFTSTFFTAGATAPATVAYMAFLSSLPDVLLSGGNLKKDPKIDLNEANRSNAAKIDSLRKTYLNKYHSTIWHELTHASNFRRVEIENGHWVASDYWSHLVGTEVGHNLAGDGSYGVKGDNNWEQIALVEGWANYEEWIMSNKYLGYNSLGYDADNNPWTFSNYSTIAISSGDLFRVLAINGCSHPDMEKCLTTRTLVGFRDNLIQIYPDKKELITEKVKL